MDLRDEDFNNVNPGEPRILIEQGMWPAQYLRKEGRPPGRYGEKLYVWWRIFMSLDKGRSVVLPRYYNIERDKGGRLKFGHHHAFRRDWVQSNYGRLPLEPNKFPPSIWEQGVFLVEVVTVRKSNDGPLPSSLYWSRIGRIVRPLAEGETWEGLPLQPFNSSE